MSALGTERRIRLPEAFRGERLAERLPARLMTACGVLWLALFPLANDFTYTHITRTKWLCALGFAALTIALTAAARMMQRKRSLESSETEKTAEAIGGPGRQRLNLPLIFGLVYFAWVALSAFFGAWADLRNAAGERTVWMGAVRYEGLLTHLCYAAVFLFMACARGRMRTVTAAAGAALVLFAGVIALQYAGLNPLGLYPSGLSIRTSYEFQGTIGNIDMVNGYLCLVVPLLCASFLTEGVSRLRAALLAAGLAGVLLQLMMEVQAGYVSVAAGVLLVLWLMLTKPESRARCLAFGAALCLTALLRAAIDLPWLDGSASVCLTLHRGRWLGLFGGLGAALALLAFAAKRHPGKAMKPWAAWLTLALLAVAAVAVVWLLPIPERAGGLWEMREVLHGRGQDSYGSWRLGAWRHAWAMFLEHPVFGGGPDTFMTALETRLAVTGSYLGEHFDNPHNLYLTILANNGLPALLAYLGMLALTLRKCLKRRTAASAALAAAVICYSAQGLFSFSICLVSPMAWCVMGMAAGEW